MPTTQDGRLMNIATPLGKDFLLINRLTVNEGISELFKYDVELLHEEDEVSFMPTVIDPQMIVGHAVTVFVSSLDGSKREFTGIVNRFTQGNRDARFSYYYISVVPHIWLLTQKSQSRIFQQISVPDILKKVFEGFQIKYELQEQYEPRNYCVQYGETDFDFVSRLMEEEGIYYFFEHQDGVHKMIIADTPQSHRDCPGKSSIPFFLNTGDADDFIGAVNTFLSDYVLQTGKVTMWDYNFQLPTNRLENEKPSRFTFGDNQKLEKYDFPGGYARKYDGIDKGGGEQAGELQKIFTDRQSTVGKTMESLDARVTTANGTSDCCSIVSGYRFNLIEHPNGTLNRLYTITSATHEAEQSPSYVSNETLREPYTNRFECIAHGAGQPDFRPLRKTPKPIIRGSQTAFVVGPPGEEIFTDKYGRVKVQFNWDRESEGNGSSSCWVRVAQSWASNKWGSMFIPRIGMEVVVHFLEGDPDQPIITGCVYNPQTMPPYLLPDEKTKSTVKSNSSKGGGGFNEFRFEDKKGSEQIFLHAEKDQDIRVKNDTKEIVGRDRHLITERDQFEKVKKDKHLRVMGNHNEKVDSAISIQAGTDFEEKAGTKFAVDAGTEIHLKSGTSMTLESGVSLTLKVGGNFININPGGVFISGTMVMINSGGAAGSGSGSSPEAPKDPLEADRADPGTSVQPQPSRQPPPRPQFNSPAAIVLINAAKGGTAFCEICSRV
jgi:type VI secretion system secreted protein VgrG